MHFWLSTIGHYLVIRALNRALNGVFGGDARGTKSKKTSTIGTCLLCKVESKVSRKVAVQLRLQNGEPKASSLLHFLVLSY